MRLQGVAGYWRALITISSLVQKAYTADKFLISTPSTALLTMLILIPVAVAELFDKVSILEIKLRHLTDPQRRLHAKNELDELMHIVKQHQLLDFLKTSLYGQLLHTNQAL